MSGNKPNPYDDGTRGTPHAKSAKVHGTVPLHHQRGQQPPSQSASHAYLHDVSMSMRQDIISLASATATMTCSNMINNTTTILRQEVHQQLGQLHAMVAALQQSRGSTHPSSQPSGQVAELNVGGRIFCCLKSTLSRVPGSFLARIAQGQVDVSRDNDGRIFIDRNPTYFAQILDALREPAAIAELPLDNAVMLRELEFYGLSKVFGLGPHPVMLPSLMQTSGAETILALGGLNENNPYKYLRTAERYDPIADKWEIISDMFWDRAQSGVISTGANLYVMGGRNESLDNVVGNYNGTSGQWQEALHMTLPERVFGAGFALVRDQIMMVGGCKTRLQRQAPEGVSNKVYIYPLDTTPALSGDGVPTDRRWKESISLNTARGRHACAVAKGKVYTIGGVDAHGKVLSDMERFDPAAREWIKLAPLPAPRRDFGCVVLDSHIYVIGGSERSPSNSHDKSCVSSVFRFDINKGKWSSLPNLSCPRQGLTCSVIAGKLFAIGGAEVDDIVATHDRLAVVERYDPDTEMWSRVAPMITPRSHLASGVVNFQQDQ